MFGLLHHRGALTAGTPPPLTGSRRPSWPRHYSRCRHLARNRSVLSQLHHPVGQRFYFGIVQGRLCKQASQEKYPLVFGDLEVHLVAAFVAQSMRSCCIWRKPSIIILVCVLLAIVSTLTVASK